MMPRRFRAALDGRRRVLGDEPLEQWRDLDAEGFPSDTAAAPDDSAHASRPAIAPTSSPPGADDADPTLRREQIAAIRAARTRLRRAAALDDAALTEFALRTLVEAAIAARFGPITACSIAQAALEEGSPKRRRHRRARVEEWTARARTLYDALTHAPDGT